MKIPILLCLMLSLVMMHCQAQKADESNLLKRLLHSRQDLFGDILKKSGTYEVQILYTQINRDAQNRPSFVTHRYGIDSDRYFYPASVVKLPVALLALEKINQLAIPGLTKDTPLQIDSARKPQAKVRADSSAANKKASVAHYIKKIFLVSDNDAFNRLYEFLGQAYINESLWEKGYEDVQILHRLANSDFEREDNRYTNPIRFVQGENVIYEQPEVYNSQTYASKVKQPFRGKAHENKKGKIVPQPFDFTYKNYLSLPVMHELLRAVFFPETLPEPKRFQLSDADYRFLYRCMSMLPRESKYPKYREKYHQDGFVKYIMYGNTEDTIPDHIRIFNKVGQAYGFLVENAYVVNFKERTEFMISAVIYTNQNETINDSRYEYKDIGFPFLVNLGKVIAWHEKKRPRLYLPDLSKFKVSYQE